MVPPCDYITMPFSSEFISQATYDQVNIVQEVCRYAVKLQILQELMCKKYDDLKFSHEQECKELKLAHEQNCISLEKSHEQECSRLQKQLEEQSKQRSEAMNEKAQLEEQLLQLKQQTEDRRISQQQVTWKDKADQMNTPVHSKMTFSSHSEKCQENLKDMKKDFIELKTRRRHYSKR